MFRCFKLSVLFICSVLVFMACDDEPLEIPLNGDNTNLVGVDFEESELLGEWNLTDQEFTVTQQGNVTFDDQTIPINQSSFGSYVDGNVIIVFSEGGQFTASGTATYNLTVSQQGLPDQTEQIEESLIPDSGTWSVNNGILTIVNASGEEINFAVTSFTTQEMKWFTNVAFPSFDSLFGPGSFDFSDFPGFEDIGDLNFDIESSYESEITFAKAQ